MIRLEKVWKAVTGGGQSSARSAPPQSTIPRDLAALKQAAPQPVWDGADEGPVDERGAERFVPHKTNTALTTASGKRIAARIINISQTGVALEAELGEVSPAEIITVGSRPVVPGRRIALGMVFLFKKPLDPKLCNSDIIL
jgi:hypothetical protein